MRRALAVCASAAFAMATIALASPAHANSEVVVDGDGSDQDPYTVTVDGGVPVTIDRSDPPQVQLVGPQISFTNSSDVPIEPRPGNGGVISLSDQDCSPAAPADCRVDAGSGPVQFSVTPGVVSYLLPFLDPPDALAVYFTVSLTYQTGGGDQSGSSDGGGSAPASVIQQFGLPASGNCEDGATEDMNWSGIGTDGWGISWAQWANDGAGGAVCTRTVMYDTSTAKWVVN